MLLSLIPANGMAAPALAASPQNSDSLTSLSLEGVGRALIIAPHPDDETLAAGGLIESVLARGGQVKVVLVTNGDGQLIAPLVLKSKVIPTPADFVSVGMQRQYETLAALARLGVPSEDVIFLGYPDRGIEPMWLEHWDEADPYLAPFTGTAYSPYPDAFHPGAAYAGRILLADLETILQGYRPDLVVFSHPSDEHADHSATGKFVCKAIAQIERLDPSYQPRLLAYLVHFGDYPRTPGADQSAFQPPLEMIEGNAWGSLDLTTRQELDKAQAIQDYPSQTLLLGSFLPEFARSNEIFIEMPSQTSLAAQLLANLPDFTMGQ
jgi:LmbE family N-acetylglucosaminyl deacetylase